MLRLIWTGILLGWGAAIPIGPLNLEIMRRNLRFGTQAGVSIGLGACSADVTYLILLCAGVLITLSYFPLAMHAITIAGSCILFYFGISALRMRHTITTETTRMQQKSKWKHWFEGYIMTLLNPYTVLFWLSISSQLTTLSQAGTASILIASIGVVIGTVSWVATLNTTLHLSRQRISEKMIQGLNKLGGIILLFFATAGIWYTFKH